MFYHVLEAVPMQGAHVKEFRTYPDPFAHKKALSYEFGLTLGFCWRVFGLFLRTLCPSV